MRIQASRCFSRADVVEQRGHRVLEQVVDRPSVARVPLPFVVNIRPANRPTRLRRVGLVPPTVEDAGVEHAVGCRLHAARAAGLLRWNRQVQPHVAALHQVARQSHVVVLDEDQPTFECRIAADGRDLAQQVLGQVVVGMGLAREDDLHRSVRVRDDSLEPLHVMQAAGLGACRARNGARTQPSIRRCAGRRMPAPARALRLPDVPPALAGAAGR